MECPCENCKYYVKYKQHPNPNAIDLHYCERKKQAIIRHRGNAYHYNGQWLIPCGADMKGRNDG